MGNQLSDWVIFAALVAETVVLARLERKRFGTWLTPYTILAAPYTTIVACTFLFGEQLGYTPLYLPSVLVWVAGLAVFWLTGLAVSRMFSQRACRAGSRQDLSMRETGAKNALLITSWITAGASLWAFRNVLTQMGSLAWFRSTDYAATYSRGINGHVLVLNCALLVLLFGSTVRGCKVIISAITVILLLTAIVLQPTKSWLMLPLCAGILYRLSTARLRVSFVRGCFALLAFYLMFISPYLIPAAAVDPAALLRRSTYEELTRHFSDYVFSGVLAFSAYAEAGATQFAYSNTAVAYAPFQNVYALFTNQPLVSPIVTEFVTLRGAGATKWAANVHTLFGALVLSVGYWEAFVYSVALGFISYLLFTMARRTQQPGLMGAWCFWASGLAFGWFNIYFSALNLFEVPMFCVGLSMVIETARRRRHTPPVRTREARSAETHAAVALRRRSAALDGFRFQGHL
jgi:hypothetical protein